MEIAKLQFITNYLSDTSHINQVKAVVEAGVKWIQYRPKYTSEANIMKEGREIAAFCKQHSVVFIMNDFVDIALELNADGIHLGKDDISPVEARKILGNRKIVGGTANTIEEVISLTNQGVDYVGLGPYRFTKTKKNLSPIIGIVGYNTIVEELKRKNITIPVIGIGGIIEVDILPLLNTGLHGLAVSSLISEATNIHEKTSAILDLF